MDTILSTFTTMRVVQLLTVVIILQTRNENLGFNHPNQLIMLLWYKLSRYVVMTDIQELT